MMVSIGEQLGLKPLPEVARLPGMQAAFRLTIRYHDQRTCDSAATVQKMRPPGARLEVIHRGLFGQKPLNFTIEQPRYEAFAASLRQLSFDAMPDQADIPAHDVDLWMLERAAGSFHKRVIFVPQQIGSAYARLVQAVETSLSEALRVIETR